MGFPQHETPQWRIREVGASALSDAELLAILFRNGTPGMSAMQLAQKVLVEHGGWRGLQRIDAETLCQSYGIGDARAAILKASLELARRLLLADYSAGQMVEVTLEPDDSKVNVRNRIKAAASRRGLEVSFVRVRDDTLLRFELSANGGQPADKKK